LKWASLDIVVLDVMMPRMDGFEVLRRIRSRRLAPASKVVMLTTKTEERSRLKSWSGGADEYLTKPFNLADLVDRIRRLVTASDEELAFRREAERDRASLLDRLETAFERAARRSTPPSMPDAREPGAD
jgi:DNA-binding response OmpR family regulator